MAASRPESWNLKGIKRRGFGVCQISELSDLFGGRCRARTYDPVIKSHLLYQLS